ncbi:MAG TPA: hypothetical protein VL326_17525 [Kofleriaceae bacterium]|nr:hypothetical protein [Kofleriaceae bacterium]
MIRAFAMLLLFAAVAHADPDPAAPIEEPAPRRPTPFDQGKFGFSAGAGSQTVLGGRYFGIAAGGSYFVLDGLALDLGAEFQWGDGPNIARLTPEVRYVVQPLVGKFPLIPYAAVFYSHWFIGESFIDQDAVGTRGGLLYVSGSLVLGLGVAYEHIVSTCDMDCSAIYPDLTIAISF